LGELLLLADAELRLPDADLPPCEEGGPEEERAADGLNQRRAKVVLRLQQVRRFQPCLRPRAEIVAYEVVGQPQDAGEKQEDEEHPEQPEPHLRGVATGWHRQGAAPAAAIARPVPAVKVALPPGLCRLRDEPRPPRGRQRQSSRP